MLHFVKTAPTTTCCDCKCGITPAEARAQGFCCDLCFECALDRGSPCDIIVPDYEEAKSVHVPPFKTLYTRLANIVYEYPTSTIILINDTNDDMPSVYCDIHQITHLWNSTKCHVMLIDINERVHTFLPTYTSDFLIIVNNTKHVNSPKLCRLESLLQHALLNRTSSTKQMVWKFYPMVVSLEWCDLVVETHHTLTGVHTDVVMDDA